MRTHRIRPLSSMIAAKTPRVGIGGPLASTDGEVERPRDNAYVAPRAHTVFQPPRRSTTHASRLPPPAGPPPTIPWTPLIFTPTTRQGLRPVRMLAVEATG